MLPSGPHRPLTPHMPLPASPISSSLSSAPLFKEDKYSLTSEEESEVDAKVTFIHNRSRPSCTFADNQTERPTSRPTTSDYTIQGDPDASPSTSNLFRSTITNNEFMGTNNFFMPDGSNRCIHQIDNNIFHAGYLENGNNAYLLELPALEKMLNTRKFLMDEMSGQFYAVYGSSYQQMSMKPMLKQVWATGELIDQMATMRQAFGYTGLAGSTAKFFFFFAQILNQLCKVLLLTILWRVCFHCFLLCYYFCNCARGFYYSGYAVMSCDFWGML